MGFLDIVFPPRCLGCDAPMGRPATLCDDCLPALIRLPTPACTVCALPLGLAEVERCERCRLEPPPFASTSAPFAFAGAIAEAIPRFKYRDRPELAESLEELCWQTHRASLGEVELVVPVPLHVSRLRERGYDQAWLLARDIGRRSGIETLPRALRRVRATSAQVGTSARDRAENLRGAFEADRSQVVDKVIALVDDVVTTTGTVRESAGALRLAGAREVRVLAIARAF